MFKNQSPLHLQTKSPKLSCEKDEMYNMQYHTYDYKSNAHIYCFALAYVVLHNSLYAKSHLVLYNMYISRILDIKTLLSKLNMYFLLIKLNMYLLQ